jgi:hypothetical protein
MPTNDTPATDTALPRLTEETIRALWSKTYNTEGKPDWSHLFPYYHPDLVFQDSVQRLSGLPEFQAMCQRLAGRSRRLRMDIVSLVMRDNIVLMDWVMTLSFKKYPDTPLYGATRLVLHEDGRIVGQRDYYDLWGDIFNGIPRFGPLYRRFMKKKFG